MAKKVTEEEVLEWLLKLKISNGELLMKAIHGDVEEVVWSTTMMAKAIAYYYNTNVV